MERYQLTKEFIGYSTRPDATNTDPRQLVDGSLNVLVNEAEKVRPRGGYSYFGAQNSASNNVEGSYDWATSTNTVLNLRGYDDELEVYLGTVDGVEVNAWTRVKDSWSDVDFIFAEWWNTSETLDILIFVNGDSNLYDWSGGTATIASATTTTITKNGTSTWAENRFLTTGTRKVVINGTEYTYTGGEGTTTLTGVTPDPSGEAADSVAIQAVRTNSNKPASGFKNDTISVLNNQLWVGSNTDNEVYVSKDSDFLDSTFSAPRQPGEGELLVLDGATRGFARFQDSMVIFSGKSNIWKSEFEQLDVSGTLTETLKVKKIKTSGQQAAQSQSFIAEMGDSVAFLTFEPKLRILTNIEEIAQPQIRTFSDPVQPDFDNADFTGGHLLFNKDRLLVSAPNDSRVFILQFLVDSQGQQRTFWQAPQLLPMQRFAIINDVLHGHSNATPETFKLFDGTSDAYDESTNEGLPFTARATFATNTYGDRANYKTFNEYFVEGYISSNTDLTHKILWDYDGFTRLAQKTIDGADSTILFQPITDSSLGTHSLGTEPLGGGASGNTDLIPKFRIIHKLEKTNAHEIQSIFETNERDAQWEILAFGPNAQASIIKPIKIMQ